jgi:hypothetical protein
MNQFKTREDARAQLVTQGTMGSLSGECTEEYLHALRQDAFEFIRQIEFRLQVLGHMQLMREESKARDQEDECGCHLVYDGVDESGCSVHGGKS